MGKEGSTNETIKYKDMSELQKKIVDIVASSLGYSVTSIEFDKIKLHKDSLDNYYSILYNCMGIGVHLDKKEVDEEEFAKNNIEIWHTASYIW